MTTAVRRIGSLMAAVAIVLGSAACDPPEPSEREDSASAGAGGRERVPRTWYVSPAGDDDASGSADEPFKTLRHALQALRPGDTLEVGDGRYKERLRDLDIKGGHRDAPIVVRPADGARPVVEGLLWLDDPDYWDVRGINVTWSRSNSRDEHMVKFTDGDGWRFADAEVWGARSYAAVLVVGEPKEFVLTGLYVHDTYKANGRNEDHLIYLNSGSGGGVVERNILARSPNGRGVKIGSGDEDGPRVENVEVRYNTMYDNAGPSNVQLTWQASNNRIYRNVLVNPAAGRANVTVFELDGSGNRVYDNVGWGGAGVVDETRGVEASGNVVENPRFVDAEAGNFRPRNERVHEYGHLAR